MTKPKAAYGLPPRPRSYPTAEECAAEFGVSVATWHRWVSAGIVPPAVPSSPADMPRWRWADVDDWMANPAARHFISARYGSEQLAARSDPSDSAADPFIAGAARFNAPSSRKRRG